MFNMQSVKNILTFVILCFIIISCEKSNSTNSSEGTFVVTPVGGKTYSTKYVNIPLPISGGTFSCQYKKQGVPQYEELLFFILYNNNLDYYLDFRANTPIQIGKIYSGTGISFSGEFPDQVKGPADGRTEVVITNLVYPGRVAGNFKAYTSTGVLTISGSFDFIGSN